MLAGSQRRVRILVLKYFNHSFAEFRESGLEFICELLKNFVNSPTSNLRIQNIAFVLLGLVIEIRRERNRVQHFETRTSATPASPSSEEILKRGKYLVTVAGCNDCHSPKVMTDHGPQLDTTRMLSGHPMNEQLPLFVKADGWLMFGMGLTSYVGPWGVSFSANLTPDETGLGTWTLDQFTIAIRQGKSKGLANNMLLPPMPWEMFKHFTDEDVNAIFTYLQSIPPVSNAVPAPIPPDKIFTVASQK